LVRPPSQAGKREWKACNTTKNEGIRYGATRADRLMQPAGKDGGTGDEAEAAGPPYCKGERST